MIEIKKMNFSYKKADHPVFEDLNLDFKKGFNVVLGPNGCGKSTLVKAIFGLLDYEGEIWYGDRSISDMALQEKIKIMSYLPQMDTSISSLSVLEMVLLGRLPDLGRKVADEDLNLVLETLRSLSIDHLAARNFSELSGGQQKLVFIAQTLVRQPELIILDEPTNSLDLQRQLELCQLLEDIVRRDELDIIVILHDINLAARYADNIVIISCGGKFYDSGRPEDVITAEMLHDVYGVIGEVALDSDGIPVISAKRSIRSSEDQP